MVGINGIGGVPEPTNTGPNRKLPAPPPEVAPSDDVEISQEAVSASSRGQLITRSEDTSQLRVERIAQAKENLEQGVYRVQEVVLQLADRIAQYVD